MRILIADDDRSSRRLVETYLLQWGHQVEQAVDGAAAWEALKREDAPELAIVDWMMPGLDGVEICRRARERSPAHRLYIILLSARTGRRDTIQALEAGADDYVTKPFDAAELRARVGVGARVVQLQRELAARVDELEQALARVDQLHGILPICAYCKKVRKDTDSWQQLEAYVSEHSAASFSHGVCPNCLDTVVNPQLDKWLKEIEP